MNPHLATIVLGMVDATRSALPGAKVRVGVRWHSRYHANVITCVKPRRKPVSMKPAPMTEPMRLLVTELFAEPRRRWGVNSVDVTLEVQGDGTVVTVRASLGDTSASADTTVHEAELAEVNVRTLVGVLMNGLAGTLDDPPF